MNAKRVVIGILLLGILSVASGCHRFWHHHGGYHRHGHHGHGYYGQHYGHYR